MTQTLHDLLLDVVGGDICTRLRNTPQSTKWHSEGNALNHTLLVMEEVAKDDFEDNADYQLMMACAITHDLGKIDTTVTHSDGKITSINHESASFKYIYDLRGSLLHHFPAVNLQDVADIVADHMRAHLYRNGRLSNPNKRRAFETKAHFTKVMRFSDYDEKGRIEAKKDD